MKREQRMYERNQRPEYAAPTFTMEDYLQTIYLLSGDRGYAHVRDIADSINVVPSSVTRMIKKIDKACFGIYEKYRGIHLTLEGMKIAKALVKKNKMLGDFLRMIGVHEKNIDLEVEGIEHYVSKQTALCMSSLVSFFEENPHIMESFIQYQKQWKDKGLEHN